MMCLEGVIGEERRANDWGQQVLTRGSVKWRKLLICIVKNVSGNADNSTKCIKM